MMSEFIHPADTDGSPAALSFCAAWANVIREERQGQTTLFAELRAAGVQAAVADDGWANREPGFITLFLRDRQHQYIDKIYFGAKIALLGAAGSIRFINLLEPAPTAFERVMLCPDSCRFKYMDYDANKEFYVVQDNVSLLDSYKYFIRDKPTTA